MGLNVHRILVTMRGQIDEQSVRSWAAGIPVDETHIAVCYELEPGADGLEDGLAAQRALTEVLRHVHGSRAEAIAIFVSSTRDGESVAECASAWGATEVRT